MNVARSKPQTLAEKLIREYSVIKKYSVLEIAPLNKPLGSQDYSPIETSISNLSTEFPNLVGRRISTLVVCAEGSSIPGAITTAKPIGDWYEKESREIQALYDAHFTRSIALAGNADIVHNHCAELLDWPGVRSLEKPIFNTIHISERHPKIENYSAPGNLYIAISEAHRRAIKQRGIEVARVIYHGIDVDNIPFQMEKEGYAFCIGRITPDKGQHLAIQAAKEAGLKLVLAGPVQQKARDIHYFQELVEPHIEQRINFSRSPEEAMREILSTESKVIYCGEIGREKYLLYSYARATLFPICWEEPFGLVMVESMATGTPVVAFRRGSVPEIIEDGKSGLILEQESVEALREGLDKTRHLRPEDCRKRAEYFSKEKMALNYAQFFEEILQI